MPHRFAANVHAVVMPSRPRKPFPTPSPALSCRGDFSASLAVSKNREDSGVDPLTGANLMSILLYKHMWQRCALGQGGRSAALAGRRQAIGRPLDYEKTLMGKHNK